MSKNKRIYQVAIELNISHSDIIDFLNGIGEAGYSHMSEIDGGVYNKIISKYSKDKKKQEVYAKEKARNTIQSTRSIETQLNESFAENPKKTSEVKKSSSEKTLDKGRRIGLKIIERPQELFGTQRTP